MIHRTGSIVRLFTVQSKQTARPLPESCVALKEDTDGLSHTIENDRVVLRSVGARRETTKEPALLAEVVKASRKKSASGEPTKASQ